MLAIRVHLFFSYFISFGCVKLLIKIIALDPRMHLLYKYAIVAKPYISLLRADQDWINMTLHPDPETSGQFPLNQCTQN